MSSADPPPGPPSLLIETLAQYNATTYSNVAATAWLAYDIILTLPQEVALIWRAKWSVPKALYFCVRYYTFSALLFTLIVTTSRTVSTSFCQHWVWFNVYNGTFLTAGLGEAMFLMRLYASYQRRRGILILISCAYTFQVVFGLVTVTLVTSTITVLPRPPGLPLPGCQLTPGRYLGLTLAAWATSLGTACIYFILILNKFMHNVSLRRASHTESEVPILDLPRISPIIYLFLRDTTFYFFLVFAGTMINLLFDVLPEQRMFFGTSNVWLTVIYSVSASRLCLNTRESVQGGQVDVDTFWADDVELEDCVIAPTEPSSRHSSEAHPANGTRGKTAPDALFRGHRSSRVDLARSTFDFNGKHASSSSTRNLADEGQHPNEDYELITVAPWIVLERPGEFNR